MLRVLPSRASLSAESIVNKTVYIPVKVKTLGQLHSSCSVFQIVCQGVTLSNFAFGDVVVAVVVAVVMVEVVAMVVIVVVVDCWLLFVVCVCAFACLIVCLLGLIFLIFFCFVCFGPQSDVTPPRTMSTPDC